MRQAPAGVEQSLASGFPPEADGAIAEGCRVGTTALIDAARSMGCATP